jgi:hypothetical protein
VQTWHLFQSLVKDLEMLTLRTQSIASYMLDHELEDSSVPQQSDLDGEDSWAKKIGPRARLFAEEVIEHMAVIHFDAMCHGHSGALYR